MSLRSRVVCDTHVREIRPTLQLRILGRLVDLERAARGLKFIICRVMLTIMLLPVEFLTAVVYLQQWLSGDGME